MMSRILLLLQFFVRNIIVFCEEILIENSTETSVMTSSVSTTTATTTTEIPSSDSIWCPTSQVGNQCPESTLLSFYKCCGHLNKECCFHLRVWIVIMVIVLPTCLLLPATTFIVRRIVCFPKRAPRGAHPVTSDRVRQLTAEETAEHERRDSEDMVML